MDKGISLPKPPEIPIEDKLFRLLEEIFMGTPRVYEFDVPNSERIFRLNGYAKYLTIRNSGSSDLKITFPGSANKYYTIPSGTVNGNPITIGPIKRKVVDKIIMKADGNETQAEVFAILW